MALLLSTFLLKNLLLCWWYYFTCDWCLVVFLFVCLFIWLIGWLGGWVSGWMVWNNFQYSFSFCICSVKLWYSVGIFFSGLFYFQIVLYTSCICMCVFNLEKFSSMTLLKIFSVPVAWDSSHLCCNLKVWSFNSIPHFLHVNCFYLFPDSFGLDPLLVSLSPDIWSSTWSILLVKISFAFSSWVVWFLNSIFISASIFLFIEFYIRVLDWLFHSHQPYVYSFLGYHSDTYALWVLSP